MFPSFVYRLLGIALIFLVTVFFAGCIAPSGDAGEGKRWFTMHNCSSCHGLQGNDGRAVSIAGIPMSFNSFLRKLRTTDSVSMPPFPKSKLSREDAADIYIYLKSQNDT